eukprot:2604832-Amphidinium_carterae.1
MISEEIPSKTIVHIQKFIAYNKALLMGALIWDVSLYRGYKRALSRGGSLIEGLSLQAKLALSRSFDL